MQIVQRNPSLTHILAGSLVLHIVAAFGVRLLAGFWLPEIIVFDDEVFYHESGASIAGHYAAGLANPIPGRAWAEICGLLYLAFWPDPTVVKVFNSVLGVWSAFLLTSAVFSIYRDEKIARTALYFSLYLPPVVFLSSTILKEQFAAFCLCLFVYGVVRRDMKGIVCAGLACILIIWVRNNFVFVMGLSVVFAVAGPVLLTSRLSNGVRVLVLLVLALTAVFATSALQRSDFFKGTKLGLVLAGSDDRGLTTLSRDDMVVLRYLDRDQIITPRNMVVPPARALYTPSPLRGMKTLDTRIIVVEGLIRAVFWYLAMPFVVIALFRSEDFGHFVLFGVTVGIFLAAAYTVLTGFPETERYRWSMMPLFFALAAVGWHTKLTVLSNSTVQIAWWGSVIMFNAVYISS